MEVTEARLCGKSVDLEWLVTQGYEVVGVELAEFAAQTFFAERGLDPTRRADGDSSADLV